MKNIYWMTAMSLLLLSGCGNDEYSAPGTAPGKEMEIWGTINGTGTRASGTTWGEDDKIGVTVASFVDETTTNICYQYNGEGNPFTPVGSAFYFKASTETSLTFNAYYPYSGGAGILGEPAEYTTGTDMQITSEQPKIDFLFATATVTGMNPSAAFAFNHQMSRLDFVFKRAAGINAGSENIQFTLRGLNLTGTFNPATGEVKVKEDVASVPLSLSADTELSASAILFPQRVANVILEVEDNGVFYSTTIETLTLTGTKYVVYTITLSGDNQAPVITVTSSGINPWEKDEENSQDITPGLDPSELQPGGNVNPWQPQEGEGGDVTSQDFSI